MANMFGFAPKAIKDNRRIEEKFRMRALKAIEQFCVEQEILDLQRAKLATGPATVDFSRAMGMYIIDTDELKKVAPTSSTLSISDMKENIMMAIVRFFRSMYTDLKCELTWVQFISILLSLQMPFPYIIEHVNMVGIFGAVPVLIVQIMVCLFVGMPVYMILMFMANYSRKSLFKFWECVPALKGLAISTAVMWGQTELFNVAVVGVSVRYIWGVLSSAEYPWKDCKFERSSPDCYYEPKGEYNATCCLVKYNTKPNCTNAYYAETIFKFAAYDYYYRNQLGLEHNPTESMHRGMPLVYTGITVGIYAFGFLFLMMGLKRVRHILTPLCMMTCGIFFGPFLLFTLYYGDQDMYPALPRDYEVLLNYEVLSILIRHSLSKELVANVITFAALASPDLSPEMNTILIYTSRVLALLVITAWFSMGGNIIMKYYRVVDAKCLNMMGLPLIFAIMPDILSRAPLPKLVLLIYFSMIVVWSFFGAISVVLSLIIAIMEEWPKLMKFKGTVCSAICISACAVHILMLQGNPHTVVVSWMSDTVMQMKVIMLHFTIIGIFMYTLNRVENDYHFVFHRKIHPFWIHGVKIAMMVVTLISLAFYIVRYTTNPINPLEILVICVITFPIVAGAVLVFIRYKGGLRKTFISPDPQWGPLIPKRRIARSKFDPKRALRYSLSGQCKHSCLLYSRSLRKEIMYWNALSKERFGIVTKIKEVYEKVEEEEREHEAEREEVEDYD